MRNLFLIVLIFSFVSCSDDENMLTEGQINAQQLNEVINDRNIDLFYITWTEGGTSRTQIYKNSDYRIEGSFFQIDLNYYNLSKLKKITDWGSSRIDLDFE